MSSRPLRFSLRFPLRFAAQFVLILAAAAALCAAPARAQYVGQAAKQDNAPELRAVAVLEWIGDEQHPTRSRIVPITVFDGQQLQDGAFISPARSPSLSTRRLCTS